MLLHIAQDLQLLRACLEVGFGGEKRQFFDDWVGLMPKHQKALEVLAFAFASGKKSKIKGTDEKSNEVSSEK